MRSWFSLYQTVYWILLGAGIVSVLVFLVLRVTKGGFWGLFSKAVASFFFIATAFAAALANPGHGVFALMITLALVFGMAGDIWLDLKWIYPKDDNTFLKAGIVSFFLGHVLFCASALAFFGRWTAISVIIPIVISLLGAVGNIKCEKLLKLNYGSVRMPLALYSFAVLMTGTVSITAMIISGFEPVWTVMAVGALCFMVSDAVLSKMYFADGGNTKGRIIINHSSYYAAQFLMASTILLIK